MVAKRAAALQALPPKRSSAGQVRALKQWGPISASQIESGRSAFDPKRASRADNCTCEGAPDNQFSFAVASLYAARNLGPMLKLKGRPSYGGLILVAIITVLGACRRSSDFTGYRDAVRKRLRDPASAEFRNERIRTLWTNEGKRLTLYCAEVNANNVLGGKTGFTPVEHVISSKHIKSDMVYKPGATYLSKWDSASFYMNCTRSDSQRSEESIGKPYATFGDFNQAVLDADFPAISNDQAPEFR